MQIQKENLEMRQTREGIQYKLIHGNVEVSGFTSSKSKSVVDKIVERILHGTNEVSPNVSLATDRLVDYVVSMVTQFNSSYVSVSVSVKVREVKMTLHVYLMQHVNEDVEEWRGYVEAVAEGRDGKKSHGRHAVKKLVVVNNVSGFGLYRELMWVARRVYNACVSE